MVLKSVHTTPMLNSTSLSKSSWPWFLSTYFSFVFEAFIAHLVNQFSGTRGLPKQMVEKLGVSQTYKVHVPQKCKFTPSAARFAKHLLGERPSIQKGESCCMNMCTLKCWHSFKMSFLQHLEVVLSQNTWIPIGWQKIMSPSTAWCILEKEICAATSSSFVHMGGNAVVEWFATSSSKMLPMHWSQSMAWMDWLFA